jgi:hypothetical protein
MYKKITFLILLSITLIGCKKEATTGMVDIAVTPYFGDSVLAFDTQYPFVVNGVTYKFKIDVLKFYLNEIKVLNEADSAFKVSDLRFYNIKDNKTVHFVDTLPIGQYHHLDFGIGLTEDQNNTDPNSVVPTNPLSTLNAMYWGMLRYRFLVMEGVIYDVNGKELAQGVSYHANVLKSKENIMDMKIVGDATTNIILKLDLAKIFTMTGSKIEPSVENVTHMNNHTEIALGIKVSENFVNGSSVIIK